MKLREYNGSVVLVMLASFMKRSRRSANILFNNHPDEILLTLGRIAACSSNILGYPLIMVGARRCIWNS